MTLINVQIIKIGQTNYKTLYFGKTNYVPAYQKKKTIDISYALKDDYPHM